MNMTDIQLNIARERDAGIPLALAGGSNGGGGSNGETGVGAPGAPGEKSDRKALSERGLKVRARLRAQFGEEIFNNFFNGLEFERFDGRQLRVSVAVHFLKRWIEERYLAKLLECSAAEFKGAERVDVVLRNHGIAQSRGQSAGINADARSVQPTDQRAPAGASRPALGRAQPSGSVRPAGPFDGSPLDQRNTFVTFAVGTSNRMAHASAIQVAETALAETRGFNPLFIHAAVGHGKTHLLQAIAHEVRRRTPQANVLYLTAERFRFEFLEALKAQDGLAFKDRFRHVDVLLIDDLEFMQGEKTEQEFDAIINSLLDGGRQVVVASSRPPAALERMNERMRSRLQRGLVTELHPLDSELRVRVLEVRVDEKRALDPSFEIPAAVLQILAERLTENARELEGAVNRLYAQWQLTRTPVTLESAEAIMRDLVQGVEPRRIKIEDILRIIARHYAVSKADILSERRHRSIVWPRQIGMYLAKQLTARSLPEIGRRFGDRDHTTVLHAIRKVDRELEGNTRLKDELDDLKKQLNR